MLSSKLKCDQYWTANALIYLFPFSFDPNPLVRTSFWTVSIGLTVNWIAGMGVGQTNLQRFLSVPNLKSARRYEALILCETRRTIKRIHSLRFRSVVIFIVGMIVIKVLTIYIGMCLYAQYEHCDPVASGVVQNPDQVCHLFEF